MRALLPLIIAALLVTACGYRGPLYLPGSKPEARKPKSAPAPAPAPAQQEEEKQ